MPSICYGTDLVTFYAPSWWGLSTDSELLAWAEAHPAALWTRILDGLEQAGMSIIEMTFPPADRHSVLAAFGSTDAFLAELRRRGMSVLSGFLLIQDWYPGDDSADLLQEAERYAAFLSAVGGKYLVVGMPIRRDLHLLPAEGANDPLLQQVADVLCEMTVLAARHGIRVAVHTEAHSFVGSDASITTMMDLTAAAGVDLCVDAAQLVLAGADPASVVNQWSARVALAHWKDADGPMERAPVIGPGQIMHDLHFLQMRAIGDGVVDWSGWAHALAETRAADVRLIELDANARPVDNLRSACRVLSV